MMMPSATAVAPDGATRVLRLSVGRTVVELKNLWRNKQALGFTVVFPVMMLLLFASIFGGDVEGTDVNLSQVYVAGIIGSALMSTGFVGLAIGICAERESGMIKRLAGTPMPKSVYFAGKVGMVVTTVAVQVVVLVLIGVALFDLSLPDTGVKALTFVWVLGLGTTAATLLGVAAGGVITDVKAAPAVLNLPFVALQLISGVWISPTQLPAALIAVAKIFPLYWICLGMRSAFLPDDFKLVESGGQWHRPLCALVLLVWCAIGFVTCARTFKWSKT